MSRKEADIPDAVLERIIDAFLNGGIHGGTIDGVTFNDVHQHNACNHTFAGFLEVDGLPHAFCIDNGDWSGTVVREYGTIDEVSGCYDPGPPPEPMAFVPDDPFLEKNRPEIWKVYLYWRKQSWLTEMEGKYNYDRHFAPGGKTETHYREWAAKRGLRPGLLSSIGIAKETA